MPPCATTKNGNKCAAVKLASIDAVVPVQAAAPGADVQMDVRDELDRN